MYPAIITGYNVIIDDTNLTDKHIESWKRVAEDVASDLAIEVEVEVRDFTKEVTMYECINRDMLRPNSVGPHVIAGMAMANKLTDFTKIVVCDIDGTIANIEHRLKYAKGPEKNWDMFFSLIHNDVPRMDGFIKAKSLAEEHGAKLVLVSARPETYRKQTREWLMKNGMLDLVHLIIRGAHNKCEDTEVKIDN